MQTNTIVFPTTANGVYIMARRSLFLAKVGPPGVRSGVCVREREKTYVFVSVIEFDVDHLLDRCRWVCVKVCTVVL